jgi:holliday junction DNA helicase RuvA
VIASLAGRLESTGADHAVIEAGGVGYLVFASRRTLARLPEAGGRARVLVETHVREDHIHLYGFADAAERDWFRLLTTVQGVGARTALALLSALEPDALAFAIAAQDKTALTRAEGVGPKLGTRIVTELKDKAGALALGVAPKGRSAPAPAVKPAGPAEDAVSALVNLGYGRAEAFAAVNAALAAAGDGATAEALIRAGLKDLAR